MRGRLPYFRWKCLRMVKNSNSENILLIKQKHENAPVSILTCVVTGKSVSHFFSSRKPSATMRSLRIAYYRPRVSGAPACCVLFPVTHNPRERGAQRVRSE